MVASPGKPWAWADGLQHFPVYHEVWSRDLHQHAAALIAMGDEAAAERALDHLWTVQQRPDGSARTDRDRPPGHVRGRARTGRP